MGGAWVLLSDGALPDGVAIALVQRELDAINLAMSPWRDDSELVQISQTPFSVPITLSPAMADVLGFALTLQSLSEGVFDPSVGGEVSGTGFGAQDKPIARGAMRLDGRVLTRSAPVTLDLCAVAKGYAVDRAANALRRSGVTNFLLNVTGDMMADGHAPDGAPWRVAVELPVPDKQVIFRKLSLNGALATSGTYRNQRQKGRMSHLIDGTTGLTADHGLIAVSVRAKQAMLADGWATTLALLGVERGSALARAQGISALFVNEAPDGFNVCSVGFE